MNFVCSGKNNYQLIILYSCIYSLKLLFLNLANSSQNSYEYLDRIKYRIC